MATYYLEVTVKEIDDKVTTFYDVMKDKDAPLEVAKQIAGTIANTGFLKEHSSIIEACDDIWFEFYPPHRVLSVKLKPNAIVKTL